MPNLDNLSTTPVSIAKGSYGIAAACGLLDGEELTLEFGCTSSCDTVCWVPVKVNGNSIVLSNDNNPLVFGDTYQGLFRWVSTTQLNDNARIFVGEVSSEA